MKWIVVLVPLCVLLTPVALYVYRWQLVSATSAAFEKELGKYLVGYPDAPDVNAAPYLKGKIVVVDARAKRIDPLTAKLSGAIRASEPDDAKTVVLIQWDKKTVGHYGDANGPPGIVYMGHVDIIDLERRMRIASKDVEGSSPPDRSSKTTEDTGSWPADEVVAMLESLPRR
jgi:hypothetical protein